MKKEFQIFIAIIIGIFIYGSTSKRLLPPKRGKVIIDTEHLDFLGIKLNTDGTLNLTNIKDGLLVKDSVEIQGTLCHIDSLDNPDGRTFEIVPRKFHKNFKYTDEYCKKGRKVSYELTGNNKAKVRFKE